MKEQVNFKSVSFIVVFISIFLFSTTFVSAQVVKPVQRGPGPATPKGPSAGGVKQPAKPKSATKAIDEARKRRKKKDALREKSEEEAKKTSSTRPTPTAVTSLKVKFEPVKSGELKIVSTKWSTVAKKGKKPFTVFTVEVENLTDSYISVQNLVMYCKSIKPLDRKDKRRIPMFPMVLNRFCGKGMLASPIRPHKRQKLTFTGPFAARLSSDIKGSVGEYVKFTPTGGINIDPIKVVRWSTSQTRSNGKEHMGLFIVLENKASYPVQAEIKVSLDKMKYSGGKTFFMTQAALKAKERKTLILRTIPDQGLPSSDPARNLLPDSFEVRSVEVVDVQY